MLKKLDRFIIKKFIGTFIFSIILFVSISIVIDFTEKLDDFMAGEASAWLIATDYYLNFIPYIAGMLSPLFIFIAVIYFTSQMANRSEIVAILSSGTSFYRMLWPYFVSSVILTLSLLYFSHNLVPLANKNRIEFENTHVRNPFVNRDRNIHMQLDDGIYIYMQRYDNRTNEGQKFTMERFKDGKLEQKLFAKRIVWNDTLNKWRLNDYFIRKNISDVRESLKSGTQLDTTINVHPGDFGRKDNVKEAMTTAELNEYIEIEKKRGAKNIEVLEVEREKRTAVPVSTFILTLIGVSLSSRKLRGGLAFHIAVGIALAAAYIMFQQVASTFVVNGDLSPFLGVWIPNFIFGAIGIILLFFAPK